MRGAIASAMTSKGRASTTNTEPMYVASRSSSLRTFAIIVVALALCSCTRTTSFVRSVAVSDGELVVEHCRMTIRRGVVRGGERCGVRRMPLPAATVEPPRIVRVKGKP
jgi:hypothetical protein